MKVCYKTYALHSHSRGRREGFRKVKRLVEEQPTQVGLKKTLLQVSSFSCSGSSRLCMVTSWGRRREDSALTSPCSPGSPKILGGQLCSLGKSSKRCPTLGPGYGQALSKAEYVHSD